MDGYIYLFLQTLPIVSVVALIFCLMGLFFGASKYRTQLKENEVARSQLAGEVAELRVGQEAITGELETARDELRQMRSGKAKAQSQDVGQRQAEPLAPAQNASGLAAATKVKEPIDLGEIFEGRPEVVDDLKKVRGIAKVMETKLNAAGIYTYAQVARWSDEAAAEFGVRLAIIGNVHRYNWRQQCAKLHQEKYHEEV
jgi:predicted flap endonuclease-1-like 5' DNA nuclease